MQLIDLSTVKAAKATDRRALAILAYDNASADPDCANWRGVADILRLALPAAKGKAKIPEAEADPRFAPWADYEIPPRMKLGKSPIIVVTFADGEIVRAPAVSIKGKPVNIGRGLRVALAFYQGRMAGRIGKSIRDAAFVAGLNIPAVVSCICETTVAEYEPSKCAAHVAAAIVPIAPAVENQAEYGDADKVAAWGWLQSRRGTLQTIMDGCDDQFISGERSQRLAYAVMTFWPDLEDSELSAPLSGPDDAEAISGPDTPVARPAFKVPSRFMSSSHLTLIHSLVA